jgi:hypothetical protein
MHIEKYKSQSIGNMISHYERRHDATLKRDNIDATKTHLNYEITNSSNSLDERIREIVRDVERESGRKVRKDAVLMSDIVITKPSNVPASDEHIFFTACCAYLSSRLVENGIDKEHAEFRAYVHNDESTPHMHFAFVPVMKNEKSIPTFCFKKLVPRSFYKSLHHDLQQHLTGILGYEPALLRDEDDKLKSLSTLDHQEFKRVKNEMTRQIDDLKDKKKEVEQEVTSVNEELKEVLDKKKVLNSRFNDLERKLELENKNLETLKKKNEKKEQDIKSNLQTMQSEKLDLERELLNLRIQFFNLSQK